MPEGKELTLVTSRDYWGDNQDCHSWMHGGDRIVGIACRDNSPELRLYRYNYDIESLTYLGGYTVPHMDTSYALFGLEDGDDSIIALGTFSTNSDTDDVLTILKYDGSSIAKIAGHGGGKSAAYGVEMWHENGDIMILRGHPTGFFLYKLDGTTLTLEASVVRNSRVTYFSTWDHNGNRMIAISSWMDPDFDIIYSWDGSNLTPLASFETDLNYREVNTWYENGDRMIVITASSVMHILRFNPNDNSLTLEDTVSVIQGQSLDSWEEDGKRIIFHGRTPTQEEQTRGVMYSWDGESLTQILEVSDYVDIDGIQGVVSWQDGSDRLIAIATEVYSFFTGTVNYLRILRWGYRLFPPTLSLEQDGTVIRATIEEGAPPE